MHKERALCHDKLNQNTGWSHSFDLCNYPLAFHLQHMLHLEQVLIHTCRNCNVHVNKQNIISLKCFLMYSAEIHSHDAKVKAALSLF